MRFILEKLAFLCYATPGRQLTCKGEMMCRSPQQGNPKYACYIGKASIPMLYKAREAADVQT